MYLLDMNTIKMNFGAKNDKQCNRSISTIWKRIFTSVEENTQFIFYLISPLPNHSPSRNIPTLIGLDSAMAKKTDLTNLERIFKSMWEQKESKATDNIVWAKPKINNWYYVNDNLTWGYLSLHRKYGFLFKKNVFLLEKNYGGQNRAAIIVFSAWFSLMKTLMKHHF